MGSEIAFSITTTYPGANEFISSCDYLKYKRAKYSKLSISRTHVLKIAYDVS